MSVWAASAIVAACMVFSMVVFFAGWICGIHDGRLK